MCLFFMFRVDWSALLNILNIAADLMQLSNYVKLETGSKCLI